MARKQTWTVVFVLVMASVRGAYAQGPEKNEVAGTIGRVFVSDHPVASIGNADNMLRTGNGLTFEGHLRPPRLEQAGCGPYRRSAFCLRS